MDAAACPPPALGPTRVLVAPEVVLDARLALYHRAERWLAVADPHFGYEVSLRAAGALFPMWGMETIEARLLVLLEDYRPAQLIVAGDFVHNHDARAEGLGLAARLRSALAAGGGGELVLIAGNHDRRAFRAGEMCEWHATERFCFHHGDRPALVDGVGKGKTVIVGHHHPARTLSDGAGFSAKLPAFVQTDEQWILPAFSPWAVGGGKGFGSNPRHWLCSPKRILPPRGR